jgi:hypothetical protein
MRNSTVLGRGSNDIKPARLRKGSGHQQLLCLSMCVKLITQFPSHELRHWFGFCTNRQQRSTWTHHAREAICKQRNLGEHRQSAHVSHMAGATWARLAVQCNGRGQENRMECEAKTKSRQCCNHVIRSRGQLVLVAPLSSNLRGR